MQSTKIILSQDIDNLREYLVGQAWLNKDEHLEKTEKPGDGNMNFTLRVITDQRSFIIKQSRDHVEKYPDVAAPEDRALREAEFYVLIASNRQIAQKMPTLLQTDRQNHVLMLEDLGEGQDCSSLYRKGAQISAEDLEDLSNYLTTLHQHFRSKPPADRIRNRNMRKLNHGHIFVLPYQLDNGFDLNGVLPGLEEASLPLKKDRRLAARVQQLGELYLADGENLLHGDFFPGSWLRTDAGIKIIDPEFCFFGPAEFEVGVTLAHLQMADQTREIQQKWIEMYANKAALNISLCEEFAAAEVIRRIAGLAQLPLEIDLETRTELLRKAHQTLTA